MLLITAADIPRLLPMPRAIELMRDAFIAIAEGSASLAHRQALPMASGTGLLMGSALDGLGLAAKLVAIVPGNRDRGLPGSIGLVALLDDATGEPLALLDGTSLTSVRTAALNGCAIDLLARPEARKALLVGCGTQALAQAEAIDTVRELDEIRVLGRDQARARAFVAERQDGLRAPLRLVSGADEALEGVDVITAVTNSPEPVLPGGRVPAGCHVSGIGSFTPEMREFDEALLERAAIFVESRKTALAEAGELIAADLSGAAPRATWTELGEALAGRRRGRRHPDQVTFFKSVGHSVFDLFAARHVHDAAAREGACRSWSP
jgi:ornithine cyclodeaminase